METAGTSVSVNFYQTTQRTNPEDSYIHTCHHENLISHLIQEIATDICSLLI
jgi:hypothetical protein